jgi:hypothetical protein
MNIVRRELLALCRSRTKVDLARAVGVNASFIGAVMAGRKRPGPKLLGFLRMEAYEAYRRKNGLPSNAEG